MSKQSKIALDDKYMGLVKELVYKYYDSTITQEELDRGVDNLKKQYHVDIMCLMWTDTDSVLSF